MRRVGVSVIKHEAGQSCKVQCNHALDEYCLAEGGLARKDLRCDFLHCFIQCVIFLALTQRSPKHPHPTHQASCVVYGMPREAVAAGAVDEVLSLIKIGPQLLAHPRADGPVLSRV